MATQTRMTVELHDELLNEPRYTLEALRALGYESEDEPRCCSICDGPGHGYPGGGPCPLENMMSWADVEREEWEATYLS